MAGKGKEFPLAIVIRTVDRATAGIRQVGARVKGLASGVAGLGERIGRLGSAAGLGRLADGFRSVGSAAKGVATKIGLIAAATGLGVAGIKRMISSQDELAKRADRLGLSIDTYAQLRFAAGQSGTEMARFDNALEGFSKRVGEAKAGTGSLVTLLKKVSPELLKQVQSAQSNEEAFNLMAKAIAKVEDPSKRAALAAAAFGRSGQSLLNMFAEGPEGIAALRREYFELAGSQEESARKSELMTDAMGRISAASGGVKASLLTGLAPAFLELSERLKVFLVENREAIAEWAAAFGKKLPGYVASLVKAFKKLFAAGEAVVDFLGGGRNAAIALAVVLSRQLITSVVRLGAVIATTPFGLFLTGIAGLIYAGRELVQNWHLVRDWFADILESIMQAFDRAFEWIKNLFLNYTPLGLIIKHWAPIAEFFDDLWSGIIGIFQKAWGIIKAIVDKLVGAVEKVIEAAEWVKEGVEDAADTTIGGVKDVFGNVGSNVFGSGEKAPLLRQLGIDVNQPTAANGRVDVRFHNAPKGTRVDGAGRDSGVDLSVGYQMGGDR